MKRSTGRLLAVLLAALTLLASGCGEKQETPDGAPDKPLMQEEDLAVEPQPDANFTLELPDGFLSLGTDYEPNGETQDATYDSDGMLPYDFARHYDADARLVVGTDYYPETGREVISYLRTDAVGVGTPRGVKVGDSEKALQTSPSSMTATATKAATASPPMTSTAPTSGSRRRRRTAETTTSATLRFT